MKQFRDAGASVVALCPQLPKFNREVANELNLEFPVLQDRKNRVATTFGLTLSTPPEVVAAEKTLGLDLPTQNGTDNWDLPIPSRYVIDTGSRIRFNSVHLDHRMRSHPQESLEFLNDGRH